MTDAPTDILDPAESDRYVFIEKARCPKCGSPELKTTKTEKHGDDAVTRHTTCRECSWKFFVVIE